MKRVAFILMFAVSFSACGPEKTIADLETNTTKETMEVSNKQKAIELLKSIETGAQEPVAYINPDTYIQHNQSVGDGLAGFAALMQMLPKGSAKVNTVRIFQDGDYVFTHTEYDFFGPKIGFDVFRFENGLIVEHWDNLQETVTETASGRSMIDGPTEVIDLDKTEANKDLVKNFVNDILFGVNPDKIADYISTEKYHQHNPAIKDGLDGLGEAIAALTEAGTPFTYETNHMILGEGNFVLSISEGAFMNEKVAFYDLFRIEDGKIVEHWDTIENILPDAEARNNNGKFGF